MFREHIVVYEHQRLMIGQGLSEKQHEALVAFYGHYSPYFSLIRNGVQFCEYVGILQIGNTLIEILPKADKVAEVEQQKVWQNVLIQMLRTVWKFDVKNAGNNRAKLQHNSVLDLYFELFIAEVERIVHLGLIKKYIREEQNAKALKGKLSFTKHVQKNLVHRERFFIETTQYSPQHRLHEILYAALKLVEKINRNFSLISRISNLLLNFPEQQPIKVTPATFARLPRDRKSLNYKPALDIAELLLLNYHPDIRQGHKNVLALMFDMNVLWEQFVLRLLQRELKGYMVTGQVSKKFWRSTESVNTTATLRPDIVISQSTGTLVLDTKWKNLAGKGPSVEDLRQMYVYHEYYQADLVALIYPGQDTTMSGQYYQKTREPALDAKECHVLQIGMERDFGLWQKKIANAIRALLPLSADHV
jgi:5-methylcytosine-specific restriction enzyme subunit McrC